jgi:pyridoxal phosphate enzyme (YggS family)
VNGSIAERYRAVVERVAEAAVRTGREAREVTVVVAAKTFGTDAVREVVAAGARDVGENYVQEALRVSRELSVADVRWHMIGRLQRNKTVEAVRLFDLVHSLDRLALARSLDEAARREGSDVHCLVEVNLGDEPSKGGVATDELEALLECVAPLERVRIDGLMAIPPPGRLEETRKRFATLRALRDRMSGLRLPNVQLNELSMGMSSDFEVAVEEGATMVRVGSAIFGPRAVT